MAVQAQIDLSGMTANEFEAIGQALGATTAQEVQRKLDAIQASGDIPLNMVKVFVWLQQRGEHPGLTIEQAGEMDLQSLGMGIAASPAKAPPKRKAAARK